MIKGHNPKSSEGSYGEENGKIKKLFAECFGGYSSDVLGIVGESDVLEIDNELTVLISSNEQKVTESFLLYPPEYELKRTKLTLSFDPAYKGQVELFLGNKDGYVHVIFYNKNGEFVIKKTLIVYDNNVDTDTDNNAKKTILPVWNNVSIPLIDHSRLEIHRRNISVIISEATTSRVSGFSERHEITPFKNEYQLALANIFSHEFNSFGLSVTNTRGGLVFSLGAYKSFACVVVKKLVHV